MEPPAAALFLKGPARVPWYHQDPGRWRREEDALRARFPGFSPGERLVAVTSVVWPDSRHPYRYWRGWLQPLTPHAEVGLLAAHFERDLPVRVGPYGALFPTADVPPKGGVVARPELYVPYRVELVYPEPPAVPHVYVQYPRVDEGAFPNHPHLLSTRPHPAGGPRSAACVFAPHEGLWTWEGATGAQILEWAAIWLAKHVLWAQQGGRPQDWLGDQAPHDRSTLLRTTRPSAPCWCGSGRASQRCCRRTAQASGAA